MTAVRFSPRLEETHRHLMTLVSALEMDDCRSDDVDANDGDPGDDDCE